MSPIAPPLAADLTTPEAVRAVAETEDPVLRNLRITQSYHEISRAFAERFGGPDVCWCAFATWASKQAGVFIRHEEVPGPLRRALGLGSERRASPWTPSGFLRSRRFLEYARCTAEDVSAHIAEGNRLVYARLAPLFAELLSHLRRGGDTDRAAFLERVAAHDSAEGELARAFGQYLAAIEEGDGDRRAERLFAANALVGWHEQQRLQGPIDDGLKAPVRRALDDPSRRLFALPLPLPLLGAAGGLFRRLFAGAVRRFEDAWAAAATRAFLTLSSPGEEMDLSDDVPPLPSGASFPAPLERLELAEARAVVEQLDRAPDTTRGAAARDWTDLGDRMNYIVDYFRSRQRYAALLEAPFTPEQVEGLRGGVVPRGGL